MIFILVLILIIGFIFSWIYRFQSSYEQKIIKINGREFQARLAASPAERIRGLSGESYLCEDCAMLFLFPQAGNYQFWMRDMQFDVDMAWINGLKVIQIDANVAYQRGAEEIRSSGSPADKVLEFPAGTAEKIGLKVGDEIEIK